MKGNNFISRSIFRVLRKSARTTGNHDFIRLSNGLYKMAIPFDNSIESYFHIGENYIKLKEFRKAALIYKKAISFQPTLSTVYFFGSNLAIKGNLNDDFYKAILDVIETPEIRDMIKLLSESPEVFQPSKLWLYFMVFNTFQIESGGINNFKRTVNHNYFNWTGDSDVNVQFEATRNTLGWKDDDIKTALKKASLEGADKPVEFSQKKWVIYTEYLCMLWEYASKMDKLKLFDKVQEPVLGNPLTINYKGHQVTQDVCNSVIEVNTILQNIVVNPSATLKVMELGAGHGRIENVLLRAIEKIQVVIIDIPPALFVSQWYLSNLFPEKKVFKFRKFLSYDEIKEEFESSSIAFLSPPQIEFISNKYFDLFINICSLQEMTMEQVQMWYNQINRVCKGWFYTKQYFESNNGFDNVKINQDDYPKYENWEKVLNQTSNVFPELFETIYKIN